MQETITLANGVVTGESENGDIYWFASSISRIYENIESILDEIMEDIYNNVGHEVSDLKLEIDYDVEYNYPKKYHTRLGIRRVCTAAADSAWP